MSNLLIAHASDTHNRPSIMRGIATSKADLFITTGDMQAEQARRYGAHWTSEIERDYQHQWFRKYAKKLAKDIGSRPWVLVDGNHDFAPLEHWLRYYGVDVHNVSGSYVDLLGLRFAGFREVPYINGTMKGEEHDLRPFVERAFSFEPDVLVTHAPASGILSDKWGSSELRTALDYREHKIRYHFFGHIHECGGQNITLSGTYHANGACCFREHELDNLAQYG